MIALKVKIQSEKSIFFINRFFHSMHSARKYASLLQQSSPNDVMTFKYYKQVYPQQL